MVEFLLRVVAGYEGLSASVRVSLVVGVPLLTFGLGVLLVVVLPADYFVRQPDPRGFWQRHALLRTGVRVVRNGLGFVVLPLGIVMSLPLVPGPGLLLILIGISLLDLPGKRRLERRLFAYPRVLGTVNRMRDRFGRPPVVIPSAAAS